MATGGLKLKIRTLGELKRFAMALQGVLGNSSVVALTGPLGSGKTTLVKSLLKIIGVKNKVTSPTFVLMVPYRFRKQTFYHCDFYRLKNFKEVLALGIPNLWNRKNNIFLMEWAEKIRSRLPPNTIYVKLKIKGRGREAIVSGLPKKNLAGLYKKFKCRLTPQSSRL